VFGEDLIDEEPERGDTIELVVEVRGSIGELNLLFILGRGEVFGVLSGSSAYVEGGGPMFIGPGSSVGRLDVGEVIPILGVEMVSV
jgi:hypothetical protein